jgi:hypothetical protein
MRVMILSTVVAFLVFTGVSAHAYTVRRSAVECFVRTNGDFSNVSSGVLVNNDPANPLFIYCPIPEDASIKAQTVRTINVHGYDASPTDYSYAAICLSRWDGSGGECRNSQTFGTFSNPGAVGQFGMHLGAPTFSSTGLKQKRGTSST